MTRKVVLTGIKPSGTPHIGNYLGMIRPALELAQQYQALYFIADYHALTTIRERSTLKHLTYEVAATWLALGLDPEEVVFFRQSDIPEVLELTWVLACFTSKGLLNRAHAYKSEVDSNMASGRSQDEGINAGLFSYPVLMAADILMYGSQFVPVGLDQKQHIEITRDIATTFNNTYGDILNIPEGVIKEEVMVIPGLDGRKMSKSYQNIIPIFSTSKELRKQVMRIVTDSRRPEEPKDPDKDNVFNIYKYFAPQEAVEQVRQQYLNGGIAYSQIKEDLYQLLEGRFGPAREKYNQLINDPNQMNQILQNGAEKARRYAMPILSRIRRAIGID